MGRPKKYFTKEARQKARGAALRKWRAANPDAYARENTAGRYFDEMKRAMKMLADDPRTVFLLQNYGRVSWTLVDVPESKKIELPVIEDAQMGFATGMALAGYVDRRRV